MTPEEKEERTSDLSQKLEQIEAFFIAQSTALSMLHASTNNQDGIYPIFTFEKEENVGGYVYTFSAWCDSTPPRLTYSFGRNDGLTARRGSNNLRDFLQKIDDGDGAMHFFESATLDLTQAIQAGYIEQRDKLSCEDRTLCNQIFNLLQRFERQREELEERLKGGEARLETFRVAALNAILQLERTRTIFKSRTIRDIREDLQRAVNESQIDQDRPHPPRPGKVLIL